MGSVTHVGADTVGVKIGRENKWVVGKNYLRKFHYDFGLKLYDTANMILGGTVVSQYLGEKSNPPLYIFGVVFSLALYYAAFNVCKYNNDASE
jgi:hypothetical protein